MISPWFAALLFVLGFIGGAAAFHRPSRRNHNTEHRLSDEHTEGWAVGGGFINHASEIY